MTRSKVIYMPQVFRYEIKSNSFYFSDSIATLFKIENYFAELLFPPKSGRRVQNDARLFSWIEKV